MESVDAAADSFSTMFPMIPSDDELRRQNLILFALENGRALLRLVTDYDRTSDEYEDLLGLQERIGHVNVGLSEETISKNLKTSLVPAASNLKQGEEEGEVCAVCQDEYEINDTIGSLECGHRYHANCIKQWLLHKNVCPICKATALVL